MLLQGLDTRKLHDGAAAEIELPEAFGRSAAIAELPTWMRGIVAALCVVHGLGTVVGLLAGGPMMWMAAFGIAMLFALAAVVWASGSRQ